MTSFRPVLDTESPAARARRSTGIAKACLLAWADETDARTHKARNNLTALAAGGALASVGCLVIYRILTPRRRLVASGPRSTSVTASLMSWAVVVRAGLWLLPHVLRAARGLGKYPEKIS